jgi:hypothetical protein
LQYDPLVVSTLLRWGNYDYATNRAHFDTKELPSGVAAPATQALPASLFLSGKPSFWGAVAWPAIGPDVAGLAGKIPAQVCYEKLNGGVFNASACY